MIHPNPDVSAAALKAAEFPDDSVAGGYLRDLAKRAGVELGVEEAGFIIEEARAERRRRSRDERTGSRGPGKQNGKPGGGEPAGPLLDARDPLGIARTLIADRFTQEARRTVYAWRDELRRWTGTHYAAVTDSDARAVLYEYLEDAVKQTRDGPEPFRPTAAAVSGILDAFRAAAHLDSTMAAPGWLDGRPEPPVRELLPCANGVLHIPTRELLPHDPTLFTTTALPYAWEPDAPAPKEWLAFIDSIWPDDPAAAMTLQEVLGSLAAMETKYQKIFMAVGPKRSGKGTIGRIARELLGAENTAGPTLSGLTSNFGLQALIDRPLAVISDARLSGRADQAVIVERLLSVSGEDVLTVDRKHREPWTGRLPTRFLILTNELPRLADGSGALASRFVVLTMSRSFYGREDLGLFDRLRPELPGILRWALDGWDRLKARGHFIQPESSAAALQELEDLGSPVGAFVRECCAVEPGAEIPTSALYDRWRKWCQGRGQEHITTEQVFGRDLRAAVPGLATAARRSGDERWRVYVGIRMDGGL